MTLPRNLLVATDFSDSARSAEAAAIALGKRFGARVHWFHALEVPLPIFEPYAVAVPETLLADARKRAEEKLEAAAGRGRAAGLEGTSFLGEVPAHLAAAERAREVGADLVVVGTHGYTGLKHLVLGSVAERTVKTAPCSVLTVKGEKSPDSPGCIVVGTDFSKEADQALDVAIELAESLHAQVQLVHALHVTTAFATPYDVSIPASVMDGLRQAAAERLGELSQRAGSRVPLSWTLVNEPASVGIVDVAEKHEAGLIVTGSRGLTGIKHAFLGSVAERTLRHAPCSVLTVRGPGDGAEPGRA